MPELRIILITAFSGALVFCHGGPRNLETGTASKSYPSAETFSVHESHRYGRNQIFRVFVSANGRLHTQEFNESPEHGGQVDVDKPVDWKEKIPTSASGLRGSSGGRPSGFINNFWVTWKESGTLKALSIVQEDPVSVAFQPEDELIEGPLQGGDGRLRIYFWRKQSNGSALYEHTFIGEAKKKGTVSTRKVLEFKGQPLYSRAEPIPARWNPRKGPESAGLSILGWLTREGDGLRAHGVWIDGDDVKTFVSDQIAGYVPFENQRIGIWADPDSLVLRMAWSMVRPEGATLRSAEWEYRIDTGHQNIRIDERTRDASVIHSAASFVARDSQEPGSYFFFLTKKGSLYLQSKGEFTKLRDSVPLDYDFPIFVSFNGPWEARRDRNGEVYIDFPSSGEH